MSNASERTFELLSRLASEKKKMVDNLNEQAVEANINEPLADLVEKSKLPNTFVLTDENGDTIAATFVKEQTDFNATANDIREGYVAATSEGVVTGEKVIPSYHTSEGYSLIPANGEFTIKYLKSLDRYDFTKLQAIICPFSGSIAESVAAVKVSIDGKVYEVNSSVVVAEVVKDSENKCIDFSITNESDTPCLLRYFTYKEIY